MTKIILRSVSNHYIKDNGVCRKPVHLRINRINGFGAGGGVQRDDISTMTSGIVGITLAGLWL